MPDRKKAFDALIFDIDGTLWNASPACAKGWNRGLQKLGIDRIISPEQIEQVSGHPYEQCIDILLPGIRAAFPKLINTLNQYETESVKSEGGEFFAGALKSIKQLVDRHKIFLVSNCQEWYMRLFLDFSNLKPLLSGFDCHGLSGLPKNEMLSRLKYHHSLYYPVYIGDTVGDETAARLAGIAFIYVAWGFGRPEGKPITVQSFDELISFLSPSVIN